MRAVAAYSARKYDGLLNDLIIGFDGMDMESLGQFPVSLDNNRLNGFIDFFQKKDCRQGCDGCTHCEEWLARAGAFTGDCKAYGEGIGRLLRRFSSGSFKAPLTRPSS